MNSSVLRILAALLAIGAIAIGYMGYQAGNEPKTATPAPLKTTPPGESVILAAREIDAGHAITAEDLAIGHVPTRPVRAYGGNQDLIGKKPKISISTGEMLLVSHFPSHSQLAQSVNAGERAMAVKVDEVIGTGGFIEPGDRVDVLLFLHSDKQEIGENSSAQVVLANIRVLAFGNILEPPVEKAAAEATTSTHQSNKAQKASPKLEKSDEKPTGKQSKTAVLAVPMAETTKLMLAESSGKIRLALRGVANEDDLMLAMVGIPAARTAAKIPAQVSKKQFMENENNFIELRNLTGKKTISKAGPRPVGPQAIVHKGTSTETVVLSRSGRPANSPSFGITTR